MQFASHNHGSLIIYCWCALLHRQMINSSIDRHELYRSTEVAPSVDEGMWRVAPSSVDDGVLRMHRKQIQSYRNSATNAYWTFLALSFMYDGHFFCNNKDHLFCVRICRGSSFINMNISVRNKSFVLFDRTCIKLCRKEIRKSKLFISIIIQGHWRKCGWYLM